MTELFFRSRRVVLPGAMRQAAVRVADGRISAIDDFEAPPGDARVIDVGDNVLMPGLGDTHVHCNEPGRTEWEGFGCATRAAAAGGVTTLLDMPLNSIPATTTVEALDAKRGAARGACYVDVGFIGGVVPGNAPHLLPLHDEGVLAFKCFLVDSGVAEFPASDATTLRNALGIIAARDVPVMVHAEDPDAIATARRSGPLHHYRDYESTRPEDAEVKAIALLIDCLRVTGSRAHVVHLSGARAIPLLQQARHDGVRITVETCPHYLTFADDGIPDGATEFKCAPPIRTDAHRRALWTGLALGVIDSIASDHSPCPPELKHSSEGDFAVAWGGIASLQLGLPVVWRGARERGVPLTRVVDWMARRPAEIVRLPRKGHIAPGCDADLVVFDPDALWTVDASRLFHRHPVTPYHGLQFPGRVVETYLRGQLVYADGQIIGKPAGSLLGRDNRFA